MCIHPNLLVNTKQSCNAEYISSVQTCKVLGVDKIHMIQYVIVLKCYTSGLIQFSECSFSMSSGWYVEVYDQDPVPSAVPTHGMVKVSME